MTLLLGIDTGGTYTDAVLYREEAADPVIASAKALTTHHDLSLGIGAALRAVMAGHAAADIGMVSISTTLATNALVEGRGGRVALAFIGFAPEDAGRAGLSDALKGDPLVAIAGGHDPSGTEATPLDTAAVAAMAASLAAQVEGFAVVARFGVRNPAHEEAARNILRAATGLPVTCGHELSARLNGPKRAVTAVLNARLIGMIEELVRATEAIMAATGIDAPLMVVRGDGALVSAAFAHARPIETILSGPAASLVGAAALTRLSDAVVSDIGGTTTDIAVLADGQPRLSASGATVGGFATMVEAVDMATHGLGGDSEVGLTDGILTVGPRRAVPVSLLGVDHAALVAATLQRQLNSDRPGPHDGRFAVLVRPGAVVRLPPFDRAMAQRLADGPLPLDRLLASRPDGAALSRLADGGIVRIAAFTPSDAAHVLGLHGDWNRDAALLAARLFSRRRDTRGEPLARDPEDIARRVIDRLTHLSARAVLAASLAADGIGGVDALRDPLLAAALANPSGAPHRGVARIDVGLALPLVALGASAATYYPAIAAVLGTPAVVPAHAGVANAVGAVAGRIRIRAEVLVTPGENGGFRSHLPDGVLDAATLEDARRIAERAARAEALRKADAAGAMRPDLAVRWQETSATVEGQPVFIEGRLSATASGRPRLARDRA